MLSLVQSPHTPRFGTHGVGDGWLGARNVFIDFINDAPRAGGGCRGGGGCDGEGELDDADGLEERVGGGEREGWVVRHRITVMGLAVRTGSLQNVASSSPQGLLGTSVSDWQPRSLHRLTEVWLRAVRRSPLPTNTFPACVGLNRLICCL